MSFSHTRFAWLPVALFVFLSASRAEADVYNLKLLSNHAADLTDVESFCYSATSRWESNDEKAAALAHWFGVMGNQSGPPADWVPVEPILHFNNFMNANCAYWTALYAAVGEGGMGWIGRHYEVGDHTVPELEYDGGRHYLDNTYKFFPVKCDGRTILSITEMDDTAGPCAKGPEGRYHWLCYHTPQAITQDRDGYHNGWPANWPLHPRHDAPSSGPFPDFGLKANYIFVPFEKPVEARYVKFLIEPQPGWGFQLTEVNVWDSLEAQPWTPRLAHDPREF